MAPLGFQESHCSPLLRTGQLEFPWLPQIPSQPSRASAACSNLCSGSGRLWGAAQDGNSWGCCWRRGGNVSHCEGWEWKGRRPSSERGSEQDKQQTAGMGSRVPRQSQRTETGIVGTC